MRGCIEGAAVWSDIPQALGSKWFSCFVWSQRALLSVFPTAVLETMGGVRHVVDGWLSFWFAVGCFGW